MTRILVVVPCGRAKIWDKYPNVGAVSAREAYTGPPFKVNREYAETFGDKWVILSAKYGLVTPESLIPGPYNTTFKDPASSPVPVIMLRRQIADLGLDEFLTIIALGGKEYLSALREAFASRQIMVSAPFANLPLFEMMRATKQAIRSGKPGI